MSPWALILIPLGIFMIIIGVKGSQASVLNAFKGVKQGQAQNTLKGGGTNTLKAVP